MIKAIICFNLILVFTSFGFNSYAQKVNPSDTLKNKAQAYSYRKLIQKDSTKNERIDRLNSDYRELIINAMTNTKLGEIEKRAKINQLIVDKTKKLKELQALKEDSLNVSALRHAGFKSIK